MLRKIIILICCFVLQISFSQEELSKEASESFKLKAMGVASKTESIKSDFIQYKHLDFLSNDIKTEGKLVFKSPGLIKWEYTSPYAYSAIFKDGKLHINDGGNKSAIDLSSNKMLKSFNLLIINSVKGNMFDENEFSISYFESEDLYLVRFVPKDKTLSSFIEAFELTFGKTTYDVVQVKMIEPSKDFTRIVFKNRKRNQSIEDTIFNN